MASSSLTVITPTRGEVRKYGGTSASVKRLMDEYLGMTLFDFMERHPQCCPLDYWEMKLVTKFHKYRGPRSRKARMKRWRRVHGK